MIRYMLKVLLWSFTPKSKRGQIPKRPPFDFTKTFVTVLVILTVIASVMTYKEHIKVYTGNITLEAITVKITSTVTKVLVKSKGGRLGI